MQRKTFITALSALAASACFSASATAADVGEPSEKKFISLLDAAPQLYYQLIRYPKFYGDPNMDRSTIDGSVFERQYLLGSVGGVRDTLAANGLVIDAGVTQVLQGVTTSGGNGAKYAGSADLWLGFDTGRAGLWSGGLIVGHLEGNWGETASGAGALLPLNGDAIMPAAPSALALSELYAVQALPGGFSVIAGKLNWTALADKSLFANDERNQFLYEGLINDAVLGAFVPYTSLGAGVIKQITPELAAAAVIISNNDNALSPGFDDLGLNAVTYGAAVTWTPTFAGLPGLYDVLVGYGTKPTTNFDISERFLIEELIGVVPVSERPNNYALALGASQYVWVDKNAKRWDGLPVGFGPFARFGIVPEGRNVIDQFYSLGIGGNGGPFGRVNDNWGIGWAGTHLSSSLRDDLALLGVQLDSFEHGFEAFYNVAFTPAVRTSLNAQYVNSANPAKDDSFVIGSRLQIDF